MALPSSRSVVSVLLSHSVETIEVRTRFSPPLILNVADLVQGKGGPPGPATKFLKPTVILSGGAIGTQVIAPGGQASPDEWQLWSIVMGGLALVGFVTVVGAAFKIGERRGKR